MLRYLSKLCQKSRRRYIKPCIATFSSTKLCWDIYRNYVRNPGSDTLSRVLQLLAPQNCVEISIETVSSMICVEPNHKSYNSTETVSETFCWNLMFPPKTTPLPLGYTERILLCHCTVTIISQEHSVRGANLISCSGDTQMAITCTLSPPHSKTRAGPLEKFLHLAINPHLSLLSLNLRVKR